MSFIVTGSKVSGPMNIKAVKGFAAILGADEREVAACLRSGEAFRCRFLVPWLPADNPTPDELSAPCMPEWTDTDYDEEDDVLLMRDDGRLSDEDEDTVEVVMGR